MASDFINHVYVVKPQPKKTLNEGILRAVVLVWRGWLAQKGQPPMSGLMYVFHLAAFEVYPLQ